MEWYYELFRYQQEFLLSPRDHGKTTVLPRVIAEQETLFNMGLNIVLISRTASQSKKSLNVIDADLTKNKLIQEFFEDELADYDKVGNQIFYNQDPNVVSRDATVEGNGLMGDITGGHFNRVILDDIIDETNCLTKESRRKPMTWVNGTISPLLEPDGRMLGIGTRKHYEDAYQEMIESSSWFVIVQRAIIKEPDNYDIIYDDNGMAVDIENIIGEYEVLWPEKWPIKKLLLKKASMGSILFNREYQNDASFMKGKILKDYWLNSYVRHERNAVPDREVLIAPPLESMTIYQGYDLAIREKEQNDFLVCTTIGVTDKGKIYILDWRREKIPFPDQVKLVPTLYDRYLPELIGIETNAYQLALKQQVLSDQILPIKEIESVKNKVERIIIGSVNYENGLVYVPIDHHEYNNFMEEYTAFDEGSHDDMLDSTDMAMKLILQPKGVKFKRGMRGSANGR